VLVYDWEWEPGWLAGSDRAGQGRAVVRAATAAAVGGRCAKTQNSRAADAKWVGRRLR
jgi:hypothetical protein